MRHMEYIVNEKVFSETFITGALDVMRRELDRQLDLALNIGSDHFKSTYYASLWMYVHALEMYAGFTGDFSLSHTVFDRFPCRLPNDSAEKDG